MILIVPNNIFSPHRPDDHFAREADAASEMGVEVQVIDHDALVAGRADEAVRRVKAEGDAVYRGWMVTAGQYRLLYEALADRGVTLPTSPLKYQAAHEFPGWYEIFRDFTPASVYFSTLSVPNVAGLWKRVLPPGAGVVKDYVKSLKHHWDTAMFLPDLSDTNACMKVIETFMSERGPDLVGGIVVRAFEDYQDHEVRSWWVDGNIVLFTPHPDHPDSTFDAPFEMFNRITPAVRSLGSPFVTVDLTQTKSGEWRVVEVGDGQVSDLPSSTEASWLTGHLFA